jgi:N-glycosylase/DNA lyase
MPNAINVSDFALASTLECGQVFRWSRRPDGWFEGIVGQCVLRLRQDGDTIAWKMNSSPPHLNPLPHTTGERKRPSPRSRGSRDRETPLSFAAKGQGEGPCADSALIRHYLALDVSLPQILATFPGDPLLRQATREHHGLRVIRQEPWECLASFIASSSKQIVQIRQIVSLLAQRFGEPIDDTHHAFPTVSAIAHASHQQLWDCKLGFRAKNLLAAARMIDAGQLDLDTLRLMEYDRALEELMKLPGVGEKIANCALLFACGFNHAFPIDVWIERALRRIYFTGKKRVTARELRDFTRSHFGPYAGWAQQYLFFQERTSSGKALLQVRTK